MRITNFDLVVFSSFIITAGLFLLGYIFWGRSPLVVPVPQGPAVTIERVTTPVRPPVVEADHQREQEAQRTAKSSLRKVVLAIRASERRGFDVTDAKRIHNQAVEMGVNAKTIDQWNWVRQLAEEAIAKLGEGGVMVQNTSYLVQRGDNLWNISKKPEVYGRGATWVKIWRANEKRILDFDVIYSGMRLTIPRK